MNDRPMNDKLTPRMRGNQSPTKYLLSKVPEVTIYFWIIKILATTVGETAADYLNMNLGFGLQWTTVVTVILLAVILAVQFRVDRYVPAVYWAAVLVISVTGTLITDNMTDALHIPLEVSTAVFAVALVVVFAAWYRVEGTLSIHSIRTPRREVFYWLAVLVTFALGTAAGDLIGEKMALGYPKSLLMFAVIIAVITVAHLGFKLNSVFAFWAAYIVTRPLGASMGDLLTQPRANGGLGWNSSIVNIVFLLVIVALVGFLTVTRVDRIENDARALPS